ncbi:hypothetical protein [Geodermatophilus sp. SYSU D00684]
MTVTPSPDAHSPDPIPEGQPAEVPDCRPVLDRVALGPARLTHLSLEEFHAAYALAVSTGDDPALDGLLLQHLLIEAARAGELLSLRCGDLDLAEAAITVRNSRLHRAQTRPSTPQHVAALATHAAERGPRTPAPPDAPRRCAAPASRRSAPTTRSSTGGRSTPSTPTASSSTGRCAR